jgi:hypothetical protein
MGVVRVVDVDHPASLVDLHDPDDVLLGSDGLCCGEEPLDRFFAVGRRDLSHDDEIQSE